MVPVWSLLLLLATLTCIGGKMCRDTEAFSIGALTTLAYILMQVKKYVFFAPGDLAVSALIWVTIGGILCTIGSADYGKPRIYPFVGFLLILAGLCYVWARVTEAPRVIGSLPYATSDVLAFVAMMIGGRRVLHKIFSGSIRVVMRASERIGNLGNVVGISSNTQAGGKRGSTA